MGSLTIPSSSIDGILGGPPPSSGGMTTLASGSLGSNGISLTNISDTYQDLRLIVSQVTATTANTTTPRLRWNQQANSYYYTPSGNQSFFPLDQLGVQIPSTGYGAHFVIEVKSYSESSGWKIFYYSSGNSATGSAPSISFCTSYVETGKVDAIEFYGSAGTFSGGNYKLIGIK